MEHLRRVDPILAQVIDKLGLPDVRHQPDYFAVLLSTIVGQHVSAPQANAIRAQAAAGLGRSSARSAVRSIALAKTGLRETELSASQASYIVDLVQKANAGVVSLSDLDRLPDEAVIKHVTQVKGISRWAAQMLLIIGLGRPDVLPIDDLGLQDAITERYRGVSRWHWRGGRDELVHLAEPWRPYRTFGTWYLWRAYGLPWGFSGGARMGGVRRTWASFHQR